MSNLRLAFEGAWKVLAAGLVLGAGLPLLYALSIRFMAVAAGGRATTDRRPPRPAARILALLCVVLVIAGIVLGIVFIVASGFGKRLSFEHVVPTLVDK